VRFDVAVNRQRFNRETNQYDDLPPVFHRAVAFGPVAENAAETLRKGLEVVVVGQMADDSYETEAGEKRRQVVLEAQVIMRSWTVLVVSATGLWGQIVTLLYPDSLPTW
jgi:single-strand DNA-binding protein